MQSQLAAFCCVLSANDYVHFNIREYLEYNYACLEAKLSFENENNKEETCQGNILTFFEQRLKTWPIIVVIYV